MASFIPGYEYDIFISYRQKDNKGDRWVSEFAEALKTELESTFKEEISVYFDINPHDGLLETHDVDASLKDKLKCLVFIPIISRTYCDPKSFAWEHEFKAFVEQASKDQFGLKVKLPNGNVAGRVLPVQIHELKNDDKILIEKVLGGVLRSVEFIYKEPGVNRPLRSKEDNPDNNLNKTFYRNQINKVANAIDEILSGFKKGTTDDKIQMPEASAEVEQKVLHKFQTSNIKSISKKALLSVTGIAIIVLLSLFAFRQLFKIKSFGNLKSSGEKVVLAVMPFRIQSSDSTDKNTGYWIQEDLINYLSNFNEELKVKQLESTRNLEEANNRSGSSLITPAVARKIAGKLDANLYITGSLRRIGDKVQLSAQLIDTKTSNVLKAIEKGPSESTLLDSLVSSLRIGITDFLLLSQLKANHPTYIIPRLINTNSPVAYSSYLNGLRAFSRRNFSEARDLFFQTIKIDSNLIEAMMWIAFTYSNQSLYKEAKYYSLKAFEKRDLVSPNVRARIMGTYYYMTEGPQTRIIYLKQQLEFDDQDENAYANLGDMYNILRQYEEAIAVSKKALELFKEWGSKPFWVVDYLRLGLAYHRTGQLQKEKRLYKRAEKDFQNEYLLLQRQAVLALSQGKTKQANAYLDKYKVIRKTNLASDAVISAGLANIFSDAEILDKAEKYYLEALSYEPENSSRMNDIAYFLINKDRNANKGLEYVEKALESAPENHIYLHTKGWGLYKQGKYLEAKEVLQKSWDLRMENSIYNHEAYLHLEAARKAVAGQKNN